MSAGIPNCSQTGITVTVSLGIAGGDIGKGLGILSDVDESQRNRAIKIPVELVMVEDVPHFVC